MQPEPVTPTAPRPIRRVTLTQWWRDLAFLHWPVSPSAVAPLLPPGTVPDLFDGVTYVGLIAFRMDDVGRRVGVPYFGTFPETNIRLYSVDQAGRRGVVFRSLDAARLAPVVVGRRWLALNYVWSTMRIAADGHGVYRYTSRRRWPDPGPRSRITVRRDPVALTEPTPLEHFLTARWGLHTTRRGRTVYLPNVHPAWTLHRADLLDLQETLVTAAGLPAPDGPPTSVLWSPGVPVEFGPPIRV